MNRLDAITDQTIEIDVEKRVRLYLLWLCGDTIFPDKFGDKLNLDYLLDMRDLNPQGETHQLISNLKNHSPTHFESLEEEEQALEASVSSPITLERENESLVA
ncbi:hypothetical protein RND71_037263 [Anisodus tanguticus]|uniref:Uncharacterized protein n=1 Tax=Anisodus tanguticus TaxID=243964 RepID=A0AAE1V0K3_9SOLA|nr:hypothetical protein RND71_037263 [Anisodus tanguticus]